MGDHAASTLCGRIPSPKAATRRLRSEHTANWSEASSRASTRGASMPTSWTWAAQKNAPPPPAGAGEKEAPPPDGSLRRPDSPPDEDEGDERDGAQSEAHAI